MIGQTKLLRRLIMSALQPLTGTRAACTATVNVAAGHTEDVRIPKNCFAYPVPESAAGVAQVDDQRMLRTAEEVIVTPGAAQAVAMTSVLGGKRFNALKAGTRLLWDPPVYGLEARSVLATDMAGGLDPPPEHPAPVRDVTHFEEIASGDIAQQLFRARLQGRAPGVVISWDRSDETERKGRNLHHTPERWVIFVVVENHKGESFRRNEGLDICDAVRDLLVDRRSVDGVPFSDPPCSVFGRRRLASTETSLVYVVELDTFTTVERLDLRVWQPPGFNAEQGFPDWESTRYTMSTPDGVAVVDRAVYNQPQGAFDKSFSNAFDSA